MLQIGQKVRIYGTIAEYADVGLEERDKKEIEATPFYIITSVDNGMISKSGLTTYDVEHEEDTFYIPQTMCRPVGETTKTRWGSA